MDDEPILDPTPDNSSDRLEPREEAAIAEPRRDPAEMSVDHLTQAFASLLGEPVAGGPIHGDLDETCPEDDSNRSATGTNRASNERSRQSNSETSNANENPPQPADTGHQRVSSGSDVGDEDDSPVSPSSIVEAILFVGHPENEAISARLIASYLRGVSPQEVDQLVQQLNEGYDEYEAPYAIVSEGKGYRMSLRPQFTPVRDRFYGRVREAKLSQSAIDLLALIAYRQPITREQLDNLRGQPSGSVLSQLVRRELLRIDYSKTKPRKKRYLTTDRFLELFGLESLEDLPRHDEP